MSECNEIGTGIWKANHRHRKHKGILFNKSIICNNTVILLHASKEICLEINTEETICSFLVTRRQSDAINKIKIVKKKLRIRGIRAEIFGDGSNKLRSDFGII
jgi:hypothetical protein